MAEVDPDIENIIAHLNGVTLTVHQEGDEIAARASGMLAPHHGTKRLFPDETRGETHVETTRGKTDSVVELVGDNALALEFGHENKLTGNFTHGLYILTTAAGVLKGGWG